jgi:peptide chain release factor subunit 1
VTASLTALFQEKGCRELVVGGSKAGVEGLLGQMRPGLAQRLAGSFHIEMEAGPAAIAEEALKVQAESRRARQEMLLAGLAERLGPEGQAVAGLGQTLEALHKGQVHTLLIKRGHTHPGGSCPSCGRLSPEQGKCPTCQVDLAPVDDIVNLALAQALESGAALEQVPGKSALDQLEGLAAFLRYA